MSEQGEVVYAFDRDFVGSIRRRSLVQRFRPLWKRVVKGANYLARVAFGTALIVSALVVWLGVIALMSSGRDNDRWGCLAPLRTELMGLATHVTAVSDAMKLGFEMCGSCSAKPHGSTAEAGLARG